MKTARPAACIRPFGSLAALMYILNGTHSMRPGGEHLQLVQLRLESAIMQIGKPIAHIQDRPQHTLWCIHDRAMHTMLCTTSIPLSHDAAACAQHQAPPTNQGTNQARACSACRTHQSAATNTAPLPAAQQRDQRRRSRRRLRAHLAAPLAAARCTRGPCLAARLTAAGWPAAGPAAHTPWRRAPWRPASAARSRARRRPPRAATGTRSRRLRCPEPPPRAGRRARS
jgi:hypothetical protein